MGSVVRVGMMELAVVDRGSDLFNYFHADCPAPLRSMDAAARRAISVSGGT